MKLRLLVVGLAAVLVTVVGAGLAGSLGHDEPTHLPNPNVDEVYVAGPDGNALKCRGKLVKVKRSALGGRIPPLTPAQAQAQARRGSEAPSLRVARCAVGPDGKETGAVTLVDASPAP
jgi:hypothetical protein